MNVTFSDPKGNTKVTQKVTPKSADRRANLGRCYLVTSFLPQIFFSDHAPEVFFQRRSRKRKNPYVPSKTGNKVTGQPYPFSTLGDNVLLFPLPFCYLALQKGNRGDAL